MVTSRCRGAPGLRAEDGAGRIARRRLREFIIHLMVYFAAMLLLVPINLALTDSPWFLLPLVGWGAPLALHAAWAMGLWGAARN